jgi:hypothetical protein
MAVVIVEGGGKGAIVTAAINCCHNQQHRHWSRRLNPTIAAIYNNQYCRRQQPPSPVPYSQQQ